jgi:hypothetical protein
LRRSFRPLAVNEAVQRKLGAKPFDDTDPSVRIDRDFVPGTVAESADNEIVATGVFECVQLAVACETANGIVRLDRQTSVSLMKDNTACQSQAEFP